MRGRVLENETLVDVADKHDASPTQVSLAWLTSKENVVAIPKATGEDHLADNLTAADLTLDDEDVARIEELDRGERFVDRPEAPWK